MPRLHALAGCTRTTLATVVTLVVVDIVLVSWHRVLFPQSWKYVMWEGGVLETVTVLQFLAGALVFALAALASPPRSARRRWLFLFALAELVLAGEETNYGRDMLILNLADPDFATRYNPQGGNLHNAFLPNAYVPIGAFFVGIAVFRLGYRVLQPLLRVPVPPGFLNAVLLTALAVPFMRLSEDRHLFVDEVYEWSSSLLLLFLALHAYRGWFFRPTAAEGRRAAPGGEATDPG